MIIAVANTKGGTGKTTTAVQLALYRQSLGHEVWLVDGDEQQSALTAVSIRSENNVKPALACSAYSDARTLKSQIEAQINKWEDIIIDVGGRDTGALRAALLVCDLLLVPVQPFAMPATSALISRPIVFCLAPIVRELIIKKPRK